MAHPHGLESHYLESHVMCLRSGFSKESPVARRPGARVDARSGPPGEWLLARPPTALVDAFLFFYFHCMRRTSEWQ